VERMLRRLRIEPKEFLELNAIESIADLVRSGLGVAILPHLQGGRWLGDARLRVVDIPKAEVRRIAVVQARDSAQAAVIGALIREFQSRLQG
jgi:DNA-binding transcriptional LysR family regulator